MVSRAQDFGNHLHRIRAEVFEESLRDFSKRIGLSPSYINKIEAGEVGAPRRSTVIEIAEKLAMKPDGLLLKAGYVPDDLQRSGDRRKLVVGRELHHGKGLVERCTRDTDDPAGLMEPIRQRLPAIGCAGSPLFKFRNHLAC